MSHRDSVTAPPEGAEVTGGSDSTPIAAFEAPERGLYGVQFHPEVVHTPHGQEVLKNFLYGIAGARPTWTPGRGDRGAGRAHPRPGRQRARAVRPLRRRRLGGRRAARAQGGRRPAHVRLRRPRPAAQGRGGAGGRDVRGALPRPARPRRRGRRASSRGSRASPTRRRSAASSARSSSASSRRRRHKLGEAPFLVQGTLYSDVIESGGTDGVAAKIKSHHNVGGLPDDMTMELVEPLRLALQGRGAARRRGARPARGDGLAAPVPRAGPRDPDHRRRHRERLEILREADAILLEEVRRAGLYRELWQCFAVLPAIRSVGVQGDERTYGYPIVIRAVTSEDAMTADWARLPYDLLETISSRIVERDPGGEPRRARPLVEAARDDRVGIAGSSGWDVRRGARCSSLGRRWLPPPRRCRPPTAASG